MRRIALLPTSLLAGFALLLAACSSPGPTNTAPSVTITAPSDGASFASGATVAFSGNASDVEDGDVTSSLVWTSDLDGQLGTGGTASVVLSDGDHTVTASVLDSAGATGSAQVSVSVGGSSTSCTSSSATDLPTLISSPTTLAEDCYFSEFGTVVTATLTIEPGVTILFGANASFTIDTGGAIDADASGGDAIVLTAENGLPGGWYGLQVQSSTVLNVLDNVIVELAGAESFGANGNIGANARVYDGATITIQNSTFRDSSGYGMFFDDGASVAYSANTFDGNSGAPLALASNQLGLLDGTASTYAINVASDAGFIEVSASQTLTSQTWPANDLPYRLNGSHYIGSSSGSDSPIVSVGAGAEFEFDTLSGLMVRRGAIDVNGTAGDAVVFRSSNDTPGSWWGVVVRSANPQNAFDYAIFEDAGAENFGFNGNTPANLLVDNDAATTIQNSTFRNSSGYGLAVDPGVALTVSSNTFDGNAGPPLRIPSNLLGSLDGLGSTYGTNASVDGAYIDVLASSTVTSQTWEPADLRYRFTGSHYVGSSNGSDTPSVTITAGAEFEFSDDAGLQVRRGSLEVNGTSADEVLFTSVSATPGAWYGLVFRTTGNTISYATVEDGGAENFGFNGNAPANLVVQQDGSLSATNSIIRDSSGCGVQVDVPGSTFVDDVSNSFSNNTQGNVCTY